MYEMLIHHKLVGNGMNPFRSLSLERRISSHCLLASTSYSRSNNRYRYDVNIATKLERACFLLHLPLKDGLQYLNQSKLAQHRSFTSTIAVEEDELYTDIEENDGTPLISVEEQYSRKTPVEHVLLRPGMYVGPNERLPPTPYWVLEELPLPPPPSKPLAMPIRSTSAARLACYRSRQESCMASSVRSSSMEVAKIYLISTTPATLSVTRTAS